MTIDRYIGKHTQFLEQYKVVRKAVQKFLLALGIIISERRFFEAIQHIGYFPDSLLSDIRLCIFFLEKDSKDCYYIIGIVIALDFW